MDCLFNEITNSENVITVILFNQSEANIQCFYLYINVIIWLDEYDEYNRGIKIKLNCIIKFYGMSREWY